MYYISRFTRLYAIFTVFDNLYYYISHLSCYDIILFLQAKQKLSHDPIGERRKVVGIAAHKAMALLQLYDFWDVNIIIASVVTVVL